MNLVMMVFFEIHNTKQMSKTPLTQSSYESLCQLWELEIRIFAWTGWHTLNNRLNGKQLNFS